VLLSTHNTTEVAALCQHVVVMREGQVRFLGTPRDLAEVATGHVWESDAPDRVATRSWMTADGGYRHLGNPPAGQPTAAPTLDDGYLLVAAGGVRP
jgi:ABC-2 type transport system ATP-binding protein